MAEWRCIIKSDIFTANVIADTAEEAKQKLIDEWYKDDDKMGLSLTIIGVRKVSENVNDRKC